MNESHDSRAEDAPVTEPPLCRAARCELPTLAHLVMSFAVLLLAVAVSLA